MQSVSKTKVLLSYLFALLVNGYLFFTYSLMPGVEYAFLLFLPSFALCFLKIIHALRKKQKIHVFDLLMLTMIAITAYALHWALITPLSEVVV